MLTPRDKVGVFSPTIMRFRELRVWQEGVALVADVYHLTSTFPISERYGLTSQMQRAAVSIPANIAEGHGRATVGEFLNQLSVARGSANELETLLYVAQTLELVSSAQVNPMVDKLSYVQAMIVNMRTKLNRTSRRKQSQQ